MGVRAEAKGRREQFPPALFASCPGDFAEQFTQTGLFAWPLCAPPFQAEDRRTNARPARLPLARRIGGTTARRRALGAWLPA
jgi:hypothetical protein